MASIRDNPGGLPIKKIAVALVILLFSLWALWFLAVPESFLAGYIQRFAADRSIAIELTGFKKGFFYTLHVERASINKHLPRSNQPPASPPGEGRGEGPPLVVVQDLAVTPDMYSFLKLTPQFNFSGQIGQGRIRGAASRERGGLTVTVHGEHIDVGSLPILAQSGIYGEGNIAFDFRWKESQGEIVFSIDEAKLSGILAGNSAVPLNFFRSVKGLLTLGNTITVNSLALEGPGIYVRVKGEINKGSLDGRAEVMVDASFPQYPLLQPLLEKYMVSPGYYVIPFSHADFTSSGQP
jgi:type II secretion system protein N